MMKQNNRWKRTKNIDYLPCCAYKEIKDIDEELKMQHCVASKSSVENRSICRVIVRMNFKSLSNLIRGTVWNICGNILMSFLKSALKGTELFEMHKFWTKKKLRLLMFNGIAIYFISDWF